MLIISRPFTGETFVSKIFKKSSADFRWQLSSWTEQQSLSFFFLHIGEVWKFETLSSNAKASSGVWIVSSLLNAVTAMLNLWSTGPWVCPTSPKTCDTLANLSLEWGGGQNLQTGKCPKQINWLNMRNHKKNSPSIKCSDTCVLRQLDCSSALQWHSFPLCRCCRSAGIKVIISN